MIFIIEDDNVMAECIARACSDYGTRVFSNAIEAMEAISDTIIPELIFLDIILEGPDGFTFLNELVSYTDTAKIPIIVVSSIDFQNKDLSAYGVVGILNKDTMVPEDIKKYAKEYCDK